MASLSVNFVISPKNSRTVTSIDICHPTTEKNLRVNLNRDKVISKGCQICQIYQFMKAFCVQDNLSPHQVCSTFAIYHTGVKEIEIRDRCL